MNPKLRLLIDGVRLTHIPIFNRGTYGVSTTKPWCCGCKGLVWHPCPVLKAAKELEDASEESS
jgi:hypothetical protein